jgi:hypothetical protein
MSVPGTKVGKNTAPPIKVGLTIDLSPPTPDTLDPDCSWTTHPSFAVIDKAGFPWIWSINPENVVAPVTFWT